MTLYFISRDSKITCGEVWSCVELYLSNVKQLYNDGLFGIAITSGLVQLIQYVKLMSNVCDNNLHLVGLRNSKKQC